MKTKMISFVVVAVVTFLNTAQGNLIFGWERLTQAEVIALKQDSDTTIVATGQFRAGSPQIRVDSGEMNPNNPDDDFSGIIWDIEGGVNSISAVFDTPDLVGTFELEATGSAGTNGSARMLPTQWFNQVLVAYYSDFIIMNINGTINGEAFNLSTDYSTYEDEDRYDAVLFSWYIPHGTTPSFSVTAGMTMTTPLPGLVGDQFQSNVQLVQNLKVIPEPTTFGLIGIVFLVIGLKRIRSGM